MKHLFLVLYSSALLAAIVLSIQYQHAPHARFPETTEVENVAAKRYYEWLRLHDPATGEIPRGIHQRELAFARTIGARYAALAPNANATIHTNGWASAGPINSGGRTQAVVIDYTNDKTVLIATAQGGVWRSTDGAETWARMTTAAQMKDIMSLVQDHRTGHLNEWYCGTGELLSTTDRRISVVGPPRWRTTDIGDGIYKSVDSGKTWSLLQSTYDATAIELDSVFDGVWNIVVDNSKPSQSIVYAAGYGAIMRSTDGGTTWSHVLGDMTNKSFCTDVQITSTGVLYAYLSQDSRGSTAPTTAGVWRSTNGTTWTNITPSNWPLATQRLKIAIAPTNENGVYVGGSDDTAGVNPILFHYQYVDGDGSGSHGRWEDRSASLPSVTDPNSVSGMSTLGGYALLLKVSPQDENTLFIGGTNLYRSTNGFADESQIDWIGGYADSLNLHPDNHDMAFSRSNPALVYEGNDAGVCATNDINRTGAPPVIWEDRNTFDVASIIYDVGVDHYTDGDSVIVGGFQDQGCWVGQEGKPWDETATGDGCFVAVGGHASAYYFSGQFGNIYQWPVGTNSIRYISPYSGFPDAQFVAPWIIDPTDTSVIYLSTGHVIQQNAGILQGANSWNSLGRTAVSTDKYITAFGMSITPAEHMYYGTSDGQLYSIANIKAPTLTPVDITGSIFPKHAFISCVAVDPDDANKIIACFSNYHVVSLFASDDGGKNWRNISGNLEQNADGSGDGPSTRWVTIVHQKGQTIYLVGTSVGLFSTTDISSNVIWQPEGLSTIGRITVENIDARQSDGFVAIATQGEGVFTTFVTADAPQGVALSQHVAEAFSVAPNPARSFAKISLAMADPTSIQISIVDATGRMVESVFRGTAQSGASTYGLDCTRLASGTYYVELLSGDAVETRRIVVTK